MGSRVSLVQRGRECRKKRGPGPDRLLWKLATALHRCDFAVEQRVDRRLSEPRKIFLLACVYARLLQFTIRLEDERTCCFLRTVPMAATDIVIKGAREHNLRDVGLTLPRNRLICLTGVSGSGKSSLAFDTLYAEGQRRYVESLSSFARQFLGQMPKPDVDYIGGLSPSISISQKSSGQNPRSTVGTITEIYDYLRVLYARTGQGHCPNCSRPITAQTREQIIDQVGRLPAGTKFLVLAPLIKAQKGEYRDLFVDLLKQGFARARVDGRVVSLTDDLNLDRQMRHDIEVVVDRLVAGQSRGRLAEAVELALKLGDGNLIVATETPDFTSSGEPAGTEDQPPAAAGRTRRGAKRKRGADTDTPDNQPRGAGSTRPGDIQLSAHYACTHCGLSFEPPSPQLFSFNSPQGMCVSCDGLGELYSFDPGLLIPNPTLSFKQGCFALLGPWRNLGAGSGTSIRASPIRSNASTTFRRGRCSIRLGTSSAARSRTCGCGEPAINTLRLRGAVVPPATSMAAFSRASFPSCWKSTAIRKAVCKSGSLRNTCR